ncbi:venom carboxylesterase-6-like [Halyomorpha halys]|uniref:venom carboxylesterase-6-like n=1 Tax=Halyomorpha halys TaxID=286706 RepID=UPI0034D1E8FF
MFSGQGVSGQEDCLYLNVFTPNTTARLPVLFSIHPGGFYGGSAGLFGSANFFMDEDVVFVAPNYRVGTLGFLSLEDNNIPGNMGLKDQALALEWTYREISAFGGDPKLITVIGESAGGESSNAICSITRTNGKCFW